nr:immunoglobulin heavy chain junction region [Macaca mulatta]
CATSPYYEDENVFYPYNWFDVW